MCLDDLKGTESVSECFKGFENVSNGHKSDLKTNHWQGSVNASDAIDCCSLWLNWLIELEYLKGANLAEYEKKSFFDWF